MLETTGAGDPRDGRARVLVVDDHNATRTLISATMRHRPFIDVVAVATGAAALASTDERIDLAFVDLRLPDMSGLEVIRRLRLTPHTADAAMVLITADAAFLAERSAELPVLGVAAVLLKPFNIKDLFGVIDEYAGSHHHACHSEMEGSEGGPHGGPSPQAPREQRMALP